MTCNTLSVYGLKEALYAMRHPLQSYSRSDTTIDSNGNIIIGPNDLDLSLRLQKAGLEHCKHLRMIMVWADIDAPLYWWKQADCYRQGVEKISTSTMHTLMKHELTADDFESTDDDCYGQHLLETIEYVNNLIHEYNNETDPEIKRRIWEYAIQILPESFVQKRTVMVSYAALRNIVRQRKGHKLGEWEKFIEWVHTLPYADELIFDKEETTNA